MDLNVKNYAVWEIFGQEVWITETLVNSWLVMAVLILLAVIGRMALLRAEQVPRGLQNLIEWLVESFDRFVEGTVGSELTWLAPWFFGVAAYLVGCVVISMLGLRAPSADWAVTFALSLCTFFLMVFCGLRYRGPLGYLKTLMVPSWVFAPVNLIGELAKPVSLSFRLFGNMLSGTIILTMYQSLAPLWAQFGVPVLLRLIFDVFFGLLQVYIFVIISLSYISGAIDD